MAAEPGKPLQIVLAPAARSDVREVLRWSLERFGEGAATRYRALLTQALRDVAADPERLGSCERPELARSVRTYHLFFSRDPVKSKTGIVRTPRHFLVYRRRDETVIDIVRVLHDARDLERHLPEAYRRNPGRTDPDEG